MRVIPGQPHPSSETVDQSRQLSGEWYRWLDDFVKATQSRMPITGTFTFASTTTATVTLGQAETSTDYDVYLAAPENKTAWITNKSTTTFQANVSSASSATWGYALMRR